MPLSKQSLKSLFILGIISLYYNPVFSQVIEFHNDAPDMQLTQNEKEVPAPTPFEVEEELPSNQKSGTYKINSTTRAQDATKAYESLNKELGIVNEEENDAPVPLSPNNSRPPSHSNRKIIRRSDPDKNYTYRTIAVTDTLLVRKIASKALSPEYALNGYLELSLSFETPKRIIILQNGTEICRVNAQATQVFLEQNPTFFRRSPVDVITDDSGKEHTPITEMFTLDRIIEFGYWKSGVKLELTYELERLNHDFYWYNSSLELSFLHRKKNIYFGGSFKLHDYEGEMFGPEYSFAFMDTLRTLYGNNYKKYGYSLKVGTHFIQYEIKYEPYPIPAYYWLEAEQNFRQTEYNLHRIKRDTTMDTTNVALNSFADIHSEDLSSNYSHNFKMKFGIFNYLLVVDGDLYQRPIHTFSIRDLPAIWGQWGFGITNSKYQWVPHIYVASNPSMLTSFSVANYAIDLYSPQFQGAIMYHNYEYYVLQAKLTFFFNYDAISEVD
ncbi:MAG: hypothetical protein OCC49_08615 [Fibrobacterales bacterium]